MDAAYDPRLIPELKGRTGEAIDALVRLKSNDPAAAGALRTIRLTRRNLEDHWMPALRDIEHSDAMVSWRASRIRPLGVRRLPGAHADNLPDHLRPRGMVLTDERRAALLGLLEWLERTSLAPDEEDDLGNPGWPTDAELVALAGDLAFWVEHDSKLRARLIEMSTTNMLVGELLGRADFGPAFVSTVIVAMAQPNGPSNAVDRDRYAASFSSALAALLGDPAACLDLLANEPTVLQTLAAFPRLDQDVVLDVVVTGLRQAVEDDPGRLRDGYRALQLVSQLANGTLDQSIAPGMAVGVATSLPVYIDTLAVAVNSTSDDSLFIVSDREQHLDVDLGRYPDVVALFGVMLRDQEARAVFGSLTAEWTAGELAAARTPDEFDNALTTAANFTQLLIDAGVAEQQQMVGAAAATEARTQAVSGALLSAAALGANAAGVPRPVTTTFTYVGGLAVTWMSRTDPDVMPGRSLGPEIHRQMVVTAVTMGIRQPSIFREHAEDRSAPLSASQRRTIEADLAAIDAEDDSERREVLVNRMSDHIQSQVPALAPSLRLVSNNVAVSRLNRAQ